MTKEEAAFLIAKMYLNTVNESKASGKGLSEEYKEAVLLTLSTLLYEPAYGQIDKLE